MMFQRPSVTVDINIEGNVENSIISGVTFTDSAGWSKTTARRGLIARLFAEYLGLPTISELAADLELRRARRDGKAREFKRVSELWKELRWGGHNLKIASFKDVQLIEFVNRCPGYVYTDYTGRREEFDLSLKKAMIMPSFTWATLSHFRNLTVTLLGLGDVRFTRPLNGWRLLNLVTGGSAGLAGSLQRVEAEDVLTRIIPRRIRTVPDSAMAEHVTELAEQLETEVATTLGKRLYEFTQVLDIGRDNLDRLSLGGFPVLVNEDVYSLISPSLNEYGAVGLSELAAFLVQDEELPVYYGRGFLRRCLVVESRQHLRLKPKPEPVVCSAWTATVGEGEESTEQYLQWLFRVGRNDWRRELQTAVQVIDLVRSRIGATAVFEFDEERNWFGSYTPFTPRSLKRIIDRLRNRHKGLPLSDELDS